MRKRRSRHRAYKCMSPLLLARASQTYRLGAHLNSTNVHFGPSFDTLGHHLGVIFAP